MKKWLIGLIPALLLVIVLGYVAGSRVVPQSVQDNFANVAAQQENPAAPAIDQNANDVLPEEPVNSQASVIPPEAPNGAGSVATAAPVDSTAVDRPVNSNEADDGADPDAQAQARREIAGAIRRATLKALDSGEPVHWHKDGLSGDVTVSDAQDDPAGICRSVSASMGNDDDQSQSTVHVWCQPADGGDWAPQ